MRTFIIATATVLSLVSVNAFADDAEPQPQPQVQVRVQPQVHVEQAPELTDYIVPQAVPYEGGRIPRDAFIEKRANIALLGSGIGVFGASYLGALIYGLSTCSAQEACRQGSGFLYIPVVGPFITMAMSPTSGGAALAGFDGGVQVLGAALAIASFVAPRKFVVWQSKTASVSVLPTTMGAGTSAGVAVTVSHF